MSAKNATAKTATATAAERAKRANAKATLYAAELHALLDAATDLINAALRRGYVPTISIKGGTVGMVATFPIPTSNAGRPPKAAPDCDAPDGAAAAE